MTDPDDDMELWAGGQALFILTTAHLLHMATRESIRGLELLIYLFGHHVYIMMGSAGVQVPVTVLLHT